MEVKASVLPTETWMRQLLSRKLVEICRDNKQGGKGKLHLSQVTSLRQLEHAQVLFDHRENLRLEFCRQLYHPS